jgi:hypothetical protein
LNIGDYVDAAVADDENHHSTLTLESSSMTYPWMLFLYSLNVPTTNLKYIQRLTKFLDFLGYNSIKKDRARAFAAQARADPTYALNSVLKFLQRKCEQIEQEEIAIGTVRNYVKGIKPFCDMADLQIT